MRSGHLFTHIQTHIKSHIKTCLHKMEKQLVETRKSRDIQSDNDYEEKIPYMRTFNWYLRGTLLLLRNEKSEYMVSFPHNHYQIEYLFFSAFPFSDVFSEYLIQYDSK